MAPNDNIPYGHTFYPDATFPPRTPSSRTFEPEELPLRKTVSLKPQINFEYSTERTNIPLDKAQTSWAAIIAEQRLARTSGVRNTRESRTALPSVKKNVAANNGSEQLVGGARQPGTGFELSSILIYRFTCLSYLGKYFGRNTITLKIVYEMLGKQCLEFL